MLHSESCITGSDAEGVRHRRHAHGSLQNEEPPNAARERAARAGLLAARSLDESALRTRTRRETQDRSVQQRVSDVDRHRESATVHRKFAAEDRKLAELKRKESEADLSLDADH